MTLKNWVCRLAVPGGGSFRIYFFIGDFDRFNPQSWAEAPNLAAINLIFAAPVDDNRTCENCARHGEEGMLVSDIASISPRLADYYKKETEVEGDILRSLEPGDVVPFLKKHLKWRAADVSLCSTPVFSLTSNPSIN